MAATAQRVQRTAWSHVPVRIAVVPGGLACAHGVVLGAPLVQRLPQRQVVVARAALEAGGRQVAAVPLRDREPPEACVDAVVPAAGAAFRRQSAVRVSTWVGALLLCRGELPNCLNPRTGASAPSHDRVWHQSMPQGRRNGLQSFECHEKGIESEAADMSHGIGTHCTVCMASCALGRGRVGLGWRNSGPVPKTRSELGFYDCCGCCCS